METRNNPLVSTWVRRHADRIAPASSVLDLACGKGRHARYLASLGHHVTATDIDLSGVADLLTDPRFSLVECDLECSPWPFKDQGFGAIVVTHYLHRPLFPALIKTLRKGGTLIYDTFAVGNERFGRPSNPLFLLNPGELLDAFAGNLHIVAYDHGREDNPQPAIRQRLCAIAR